MKHVLRLLVVIVLFSLTISAAAYRLNPEVSPQLAEEPSLSDSFSGSFSDILSQAAAELGESIGAATETLGDTVADTIIDSVASVDETGQYTADGQQILDVNLSSATVPVIRSAMSEQMGGMVTTEDLVAQLNSTENVTAVQNEDGSLSIQVPENLYAEYADKLSALIGSP